MSDSSTPHAAKLYSPRTWPMWIGFGILRILVLLPYAALLRLSRLLSPVAKRLAVRRRKIAEINLKTCFPELDASQIDSLLDQHFTSAIMGFFEMGMAWWWPDSRFDALIRVEGREHLEHALAKERGVLLLGPHMTSIEITGRLFHLQIKRPLSGMYRPHENAVVERLFQQGRRLYFIHLIRRDNMRGVIRALRDNHIVWYAPDQNFRKTGAVLAPFFGHPAPSYPGTPRIIKVSGAQVIPLEYRRLPGKEGYLLKLHPALENFPVDDDVADITRVNQIFEQMIRQAPEQYFWFHRKFKIRGKDTIDIYRQHGIN